MRSNDFSTISLSVLNRTFLATVFILAGAGKIPGWDGMIGYMTAHGFTSETAPFFLGAAIAVEILAGLSILLGWRARLGAGVLFAYLIPTTLIFHAFWKVPEAEQQLQMVMFLKNLAIMGGLAGVMLHGAGRFSVDSRREDKARNLSQPEARPRRIA